MSKQRDLKLYLIDILESGNNILNFTKDLTFNDFLQDRKTQSAVIREFEVIGEAVSKLPQKVKNRYANINWQDIKDFRNILIHEYFGVDLEIVWKVIKKDLPELLKTVELILEEF